MEGQAGRLVNRFLRSCGFGTHSRQVHSAQERPGNLFEDCLECPVCWESFNGGNHTPYVLFCGHSLCRSCLTGLPWASIKIPSFHIQLPLLISCPWCQFFTLRLYWKGGFKYPCKNFFLLSVVESVKGHDSSNEQATSRMVHKSNRRISSFWQIGFSLQQRREWANVMDALVQGNWSRINLFTLLSLLVQVVAKLPLICLLLFLVLYVLPFSVLVLVLYCLITLVFALPSYLVLYFSYPSLAWLTREIAAA